MLLTRGRGAGGSRGLDLNLAAANDTRLTFTRATAAWDFNSSGLLVSFGVNVARAPVYNQSTLTALGMRMEEQRTNVVLWNRDLTNVAWTKSSATAAKDQTGIDGAANSASSLTATGANGTCLQSITLASSARYQSAFIKRITGTGTIQMTTDNGTTWTTVTVTAAWTALEIPTQTLANPTVGFRIVTSGDAVAIDCVQNENGTFRTTPILTTTATVTRNADMATIATSAFTYNQNAGTFLVEYQVNAAAVGNAYALAFVNAGNTDKIFSYRGSAASDIRAISVAGASDVKETGTEYGVSSFAKVAGAYAPTDFAGAINGTALTPASTGTAATDITKLVIGNSGAGTGSLNGVIRRVVYWPRRMTNVQLQAFTS